MANLTILRTKFSQLTFWALVISTLLTFSGETGASIEDFVCPQYIPRVTCWCGNVDGVHPQIECFDSSEVHVTQETIDNTFALIRELNENVTDERLVVHIQRTTLLVLDLTPLMGLNFARVVIDFNTVLNTIHGGNQETPQELIDTPELVLAANLLTDDGLKDTLKYFTPAIEILDLRRNQIQGSSPEFLPGLSSFTNLKSLDLSANMIQKLSGGQFRFLRNLKSLNLLGNLITEIGAKAFVIDQKPEQPFSEGEQFLLNLKRNYLSNVNVSSDNGLGQLNRPTRLTIEYNYFTFISGENFRKFLEADPLNYIFLKWNPLICDMKMYWLTANNNQFHRQVHDADCINDEGNTIFTTDLSSAGISLSSVNIFVITASVLLSKLFFV